MADVFDQIRTQCRRVAETGRFVHIEYARIAPCARVIRALALRKPTYDTALHFAGRSEDVLAYIVALDSVNFGSGYFPYLTKRPGLSGYGTVARSLTERFEREGPVDSAWLSQVTTEDCVRLFGQAQAGPPILELMGLYARAWNELGRDLRDRFNGSFTQFVESANGSAARLIDQLSHQPSFRDVALYHEALVPFYKRAQILASDLSLALPGQTWGRFDDLDRLTVFADNVVPHVLRIDGVLGYVGDLASRIDRGELIARGSDEEIEIRACAIHAAELIVAALRAEGHSATARDLDVVLWNRGRRQEAKALPRHRTRTTAY